MAKSNFGLVVLSPAFISKRWTEYELRGLTSREMVGSKIILPIWHNVTIEEVLAFSPTLADKVGIKSDTMSPVEIAAQIIETVRPDLFERIQSRLAARMMERAGEIKTVPIADIKYAPIRHPELPEELIGRIRLIRAALLGAYTHSMEYWVDGFKRDANPSREISYWEHVAAVYREYVSMAPVTLTQSQHEGILRFIFGLGSSTECPPEDKEAADLPEGATNIICQLYRHAEPIYDIEEESPYAKTQHSPETIEMYQHFDKERFPRDLPEALIRELLDSESQPMPKASSEPKKITSSEPENGKWLGRLQNFFRR